MTPTLLATALVLLGQAPPAPFPSTPPPVFSPPPVVAPLEAGEDAAAAETGEGETAPSQSEPAPSAPAVSGQAGSELAPGVQGEVAPVTPALSPTDLVPIGQSPAGTDTAALPTTLPALGTPPAEGVAPATPPLATPAEPGVLTLPPGEPQSVLVAPRREGEVQPATNEQQLTTSDTPSATTSKSQAVLRRLLAPPESAALPGQPTRLEEVLPLGSERQRQIEAVQAYWEATLRTAVYHAALGDLERLAEVPAPAANRERAVFEQALLAAEANVRQAELKAVDAQFVLAEKASLAATELLPLPVDEPLTGGYRTHYDTLFAGRTAPTNLQRIHRTLPMCQRLLAGRADSLVAAEEVWEIELAAYQRGEISLELLLVSFDRLTAQRVAYLELVRRYNFDIAEFALSVSTAGTSRDSIVSMLIETKGRPVVQQAVQPVGGSTPTPAIVPGSVPGGASSQGVIIQGPVIQGGPTPAVPVGGAGVIVPGQPSPAVRPLESPSVSPTPVGPTPADGSSVSPGVGVSPAVGSSSGAAIPTPAEAAGPSAFEDITPGRSDAAPGSGEVRLAQATEPAGGASVAGGSGSGVQPAGYSAPLPNAGQIVETPAPPGLEGTHSVLVRP